MEKTLYNQVGEIKGKEAVDQDSFSFQFTPQNENLKRTRGSLFSLVSVRSEEDNKQEKATSFYQAFQSSYYAKSSGSIIKSLSDTLDQVENDFNKKDEKLTFSFLAAVLWGSVLYLAKLGEGTVFIARAGKMKKLEFNKVASGVLENQDTVCLTSAAFSEKISEDELSSLLALDKFEKSLEGIDKKIAEVEGATAVVIRLTVEAPEKTEPLEIGQVDEEGKVEFAPSEIVQASEKVPEEEVSEEVASEEVAKPEATEETLPAAPRKSFSSRFSEFTTPVSTFFKRSLENIKKPWEKREPGEHVDHVAVRRQRIFQIVSVIVLVLLLSLAFGLLGKGVGNKGKDKLAAFLNSAESKLTEAKKVKSIDPNHAMNLVSQAQADTTAAAKLNSQDSRVKSLQSEEASLIAEITRTYSVGNLKTVFDFNKLQSGAKIARIALIDTDLIATDKSNNLIFSVALNENKGEKISASVSGPNNLAVFNGGYYLQTADGIQKITSGSNKVTSLVSSPSWGEIAAAASYQNNLYLLDKGKNQIWKYLSVSTGLASARAYVTEASLDLKNAVGLAIDSFVWVANENGSIYKLSTGKKQDFAVTNLNSPFGKVVDIYTDNLASNLYLLDKGKGSLVIISKDGVYQSAYNDSHLKNASTLVVQESKKTAYFASEGKLFSFSFR